MTTTLGHAAPGERQRMAELETKLRTRTITSGEHLELALLNLEPGHDGFRAAELLREMLAAEPENGSARLWLAYCCIYELMDPEALREAVRLCEELAPGQASADVRAAALLLEAAALRQLAGDRDVLALLRESVRLAPTWIANRQWLAMIYQERGDRAAAEEQLREALEVSRAQPAPEPDRYADQLFEMLITARGSHQIGGRLQEQLQELLKAPR